MKSALPNVLNLDYYYSEIENKLNVISAYTENKNSDLILKICRFKPYPITPKSFLTKSFYKKWIDEYGNSIEIKNKRLNIVINDLSINSDNIISTDLYKGLGTEKIIKISKLMYIFKGKEIDFGTDHYILSLLGLDNYLRTYSYLYGEWHEIPSIYLGLQNLNFIINNSDIKFYKEFNFKNKVIFDCENQKIAVGKLPLTAMFEEEIKNNYEEIFNLINKGEHN